MSVPEASEAQVAHRVLLMVVNDAAFFRSHRLALAMAAIKSGWKVELASNPSKDLEWVSKLGIVVHPIAFDRKGTNLLREIRTIVALFRLCKKLNPALVHFITIKPILYGGLVSRLLRLPAVVSSVTGLGYVFSRRDKWALPIRFLAKYAYWFALSYRRNIVIFQNPDDLEEIFKGCVPSNAEVIRGSGVDPDEYPFTEMPDHHMVVLLASRMLWSKGVEDFVEAAKLCKLKYPYARFVLVGEPDDSNPESIPVEILQKWQQDGCVEWWGKRHDMPAVIQQSSLMVLPSTYREGVPRVLIEAAATGRPIVTSDMPGCRESVIHGVNGFLVQPRSPEEISEAICQILSDQQIRKRMGEKSRELFLQGFTLEHVNKSTLAIYDRVTHELINE